MHVRATGERLLSVSTRSDIHMYSIDLSVIYLPICHLSTYLSPIYLSIPIYLSVAIYLSISISPLLHLSPLSPLLSHYLQTPYVNPPKDEPELLSSCLQLLSAMTIGTCHHIQFLTQTFVSNVVFDE